MDSQDGASASLLPIAIPSWVIPSRDTKNVRCCQSALDGIPDGMPFVLGMSMPKQFATEVAKVRWLKSAAEVCSRYKSKQSKGVIRAVAKRNADIRNQRSKQQLLRIANNVRTALRDFEDAPDMTAFGGEFDGASSID